MFFRLFPFLSTICFVALILFTLWHFSTENFWWIAGIGGLFTFIFIKKSVGKFSGTLIPLLLVCGSLPLLALMKIPQVYYVLIGFLAIVLYTELLSRERLLENPRNKTALLILNTTNLIVFFIWANLLFAWFVYLAENVFPLWLMIFLSALISFIITYDILRHIFFFQKNLKVTKTEIKIASLLVSLGIGEVTWALVFFPFRYRSNAAILLAVYYLAFSSIVGFLTNKEKRGKLAKDVVIAVIAIGIILVTSKWKYY